MKTYLSKWQTEYRCVKCKHKMSYHTMMYSRGRCPYCGHKSKWAVTMVDCTEHAYRLVRHGKWWQFWIKAEREYKDA